MQKEKWTVDPFAAIRKDGYTDGRGSIDDKDKVTSVLMVALLLKRLKVPLDRDVILLGEAGEEGGAMWEWLYGRAALGRDCVDYALTEGDIVTSRDGEVRTVEIATTEKVPRGVRLVAHGQAGPVQNHAWIIRSPTSRRRCGNCMRTSYPCVSTTRPGVISSVLPQSVPRRRRNGTII